MTQVSAWREEQKERHCPDCLGVSNTSGACHHCGSDLTSRGLMHRIYQIARQGGSTEAFIKAANVDEQMEQMLYRSAYNGRCAKRAHGKLTLMCRCKSECDTHCKTNDELCDSCGCTKEGTIK